eukprot:1157978-Pelagomonas_calceolata.AAC.2
MRIRSHISVDADARAQCINCRVGSLTLTAYFGVEHTHSTILASMDAPWTGSSIRMGAPWTGMLIHNDGSTILASMDAPWRAYP